MERVVFLDIDGVLTTKKSRSAFGYDGFGRSAVEAMQSLLVRAEPTRIVVHSSWRRLPRPPEIYAPSMGAFYFWDHEIWFDICKKNRLPELTEVPHEDAPFKFSSNRGHDIRWWIDDNWQDDWRGVVLDDESDLYIRPVFEDRSVDGLLIFTTSDATGLTMQQADQAVEWLTQ